MPTLKRLIYWGLRSNERGLTEQVSRMHSSIKIRSMRPAASLELSLRVSKPLNPVNCSTAALCWRGRSKFGAGATDNFARRFSILCGLEDIIDSLNPHGGGIGARFCH